MRHLGYLVGSLLLICEACIGPRGTQIDNERYRSDERMALRERADRLWAAKRSEDWRAAFILQDPKQVTGASEEEFVAWCAEEEPFRIRTYELGAVETDGDLGWVEVSYRTLLRKFPDVPARDAHTWQKWRRVAGKWFPIPVQDLSAYLESPALRDAAEEARLRARFMESWQARHAKDWRKLYMLSDPLDLPDVAEDVFVEAEGIYEYLSFRIHWIEVLASRGRIRVSYEHRVDDPSLTKLSASTACVTETWIQRDGEWCRDLKR